MKPLPHRILGLISAVVCGTTAIATAQVPSIDEHENEYSRQYRRNYEIPLGTVYTGRSPYMRATGQPAPPPPPPVRVAPIRDVPQPERQNCSDPTIGQVRMSKKMPPEVILGQEFMYELNTTATSCVGNVVITDHVPQGASYVRSEPGAEVEGEHLIWRFHDLEPGETRNIKVWLKANQEGRLASCATVSADPRTCASTVVGKPALAIAKSGPESVVLGGTITYTVVVSNNGSAVAKDVVVTDPVPEGLTGNPVTVNVGDLGPHQSKSIPVNFTAGQRGRFCNTATAQSSNAGKVDAQACTVVLQPGLKITKQGTKEQFLGRNASYDIVVSNTGDTALSGVVVSDTAPAGTTVVDAGGGSVSGNTITWNVGELAKGDNKAFKVSLTSMSAGNHCNNVAVATAQGLKDAAEACTLWKGVSALLLEKGDNPDPIQVGEQTTYFVRVTNQGTAPDADVKVVVQFPKELAPVSADNGGTIAGQTVTFPPVAQLDPKQAFEYHVIAKGVSAGDVRVTFIRTSRDIPASTTAEESTRVY